MPDPFLIVVFAVVVGAEDWRPRVAGKEWIERQLQELAEIFAVSVGGFNVMAVERVAPLSRRDTGPPRPGEPLANRPLIGRFEACSAFNDYHGLPVRRVSERPACLEGSDGFVSSPRRFDRYRLERPRCRVAVAPTDDQHVLHCGRYV
jgi:hypothetical protein